MAKAKNLVVELNEISQTIDLDSIAGAPISKDPVLRNEIAKAIVDYMKSRIQFDNLGIDQKRYSSNKYSEGYVNSKEFEDAGKSPSKVDMTLTGEMVKSIGVLRQKKSDVIIAIKNEDVLPRAHGHMTGKEGTVPKMKREFFGVSDREIKEEILPFFKAEINKLEED